jgi:hypothetical protein
LSLICIKRIIYTFFRTKIQKGGGGEGANKKDNPKEIFYEFFKLFRKQKRKIFFAPPPFSKSSEEEEKKIFLEKWLFKKSLTYTHFKIFSKSDFNQKTVTIFIFFIPFFSLFSHFYFIRIKVMFYV